MAIGDLEEAFKEGEEVGGVRRGGAGGRRGKIIVHFPGSRGRGYQVLRSVLREMLSP